MAEPLIATLYAEFKETKKVTVPQRLLPAPQGYNLLAWLKELYQYYDAAGVIVRPFDELPPFLLSDEERLKVTIQDVHKFIVSDMNLIPMGIRKKIVGLAIEGTTVQESWQSIKPLLSTQLDGLDRETVQEELSWKFSPVAEILWMLTWIFMERETVSQPASVQLALGRFPYYQWIDESRDMCMWEPDLPCCRWEWLALDLFKTVLGAEHYLRQS
ncbi:MAG: hypothetical protein GY868_02080 [Deltaproteobacteria bacterium]|nr:hypothetical protein [Deltaproteobacteria bacterium]